MQIQHNYEKELRNKIFLLAAILNMQPVKIKNN
jgi:hypothetical protein